MEVADFPAFIQLPCGGRSCTRERSMSDFWAHFGDRPVIFDGAMGTMIDRIGVDPADYGEAPGVGAMLNVSRPDIIEEVHRAYLDAGSDVILANSFSALGLNLAEYRIESRAHELSLAAARIARKAADSYSDKKRYVAGNLATFTKLPSLGQISFDILYGAYREQVAALIEGGVDLITFETGQDPLGIKAALSGSHHAMNDAGREVPFIVSVSVDRNGTMLVGTRLPAMLAAIEPYGPAAFGINCSLGPDLMEEFIAELARISPFPIICEPNAGLPENRGGKPFYPLQPDEFAKQMRRFVEEHGVKLVGGCCGTTPEHIAALAEELKGVGVKERDVEYAPYVASLFGATALDQEPKPFIVAEQTNANGSKKFRELVAAKDWEGCVAHARKAAEGAHALDVATALTGEDEAAAMHELIPRLVQTIDRPLVIDSTKVDAMEAALTHIGGRAIINSINLEDGGAKAKTIIALARKFGAALIALTIDEAGMAVTAARKTEVAKRLAALAEDEGLRRQDLLIDPLVFTLASGDQATADAGVETIKAIGMIHDALPGVRVSLGVSNVSFGMPLRGRRALTSMFLHRAVAAGADAAIINVRTIVPLDRVDVELRPWIDRLIDNDTSEGNALMKILELCEALKGAAQDTAAQAVAHSPREALQMKVIDGDRSDLEQIIGTLLHEMEPRVIVNDVLMAAMKIVGERFGTGAMPLPFVLQSAETMRAAVDILSPHMTTDEAHAKGTIILATVRGDVHDIGKNLVDAILSNNGYKVINLGIRQPAASVVEAVKKHHACAIGLSGLLVSSTEIMREDLETFRHNEISIPVLCGGAALTEKFTDSVLAPAYGSSVHYCVDAFAGLKVMEHVSTKSQIPNSK